MRAITWLPLDPSDAAAAIRKFDGYAKLQGILQGRALDLPTLPGLVIDSFGVTDRDLNSLISEARKLHPHRLLIRHDRSPEIGQYPQGGYLISIEETWAELEWYRSQRRLLILLYPADPIDNLYSAAVTITSDRVMQLEIVGPGFDASDLNRGFISPFESHRYILDAAGCSRKISSSYVHGQAYATAKSLRLRKIALKFIVRRRFIKVDEISLEDAISLIREGQLTSRRQIQQLLGNVNYVAAPPAFIRKITEFGGRVAALLNDPGYCENLIAFSASQIENGQRTVVWDIVSPRRKYGLI
jgi:hypothetical protein